MLIALLIAFDHSGRVHAGCCAKRVAAKHRIVVRNCPTANLCSFLAVFAESRKVVVDPLHQFQVYKQLVHGSVAYSLTDAESRTVNLVSAALNRRYGIDHTE